MHVQYISLLQLYHIIKRLCEIDHKIFYVIYRNEYVLSQQMHIANSFSILNLFPLAARRMLLGESEMKIDYKIKTNLDRTSILSIRNHCEKLQGQQQQQKSSPHEGSLIVVCSI